MIFKMLAVSAYSDASPEMVAIKQEGDKLFSAGKGNEAMKEYSKIRKEGVDYLKTLYADVWDVSNVLPVTGMYDGGREPSTLMEIPFKDEEDWKEREASVKLRLIEFGEHFHQHSVHLVQLRAAMPEGMRYGQMVNGTSYQLGMHAVLNRAEWNFQNYHLLFELAKQAGIENLTAFYFFEQLLIYSVDGEEDPNREIFRAQCSRLKELLNERGLAFEIKDYTAVELTNYGDKDCFGVFQKYDEAKEVLRGRL